MKTIWIAAFAALVAGCGGQSAVTTPATSKSPDDAFIDQLHGAPYWQGVDRTQAIAAGHAWCDTIANAKQFGNNGDTTMMTILNGRYGPSAASTLVTASEQNYCPNAK